MGSGWAGQSDPTKLTTDAVDRLERNLRELYDLHFEQLDLRLEQRFQAQSKSLDAALIAADLKSNALADKIVQVSLDIKENITRIEYESASKALLDKIDDLRARYYEQVGVSSGANVAQQLRDIHNQVSGLSFSEGKWSGRSSGLNASWGYLIGAIGLITSLTTTVLLILTLAIH